MAEGGYSFRSPQPSAFRASPPPESSISRGTPSGSPMTISQAYQQQTSAWQQNLSQQRLVQQQQQQQQGGEEWKEGNILTPPWTDAQQLQQPAVDARRQQGGLWSKVKGVFGSNKGSQQKVRIPLLGAGSDENGPPPLNEATIRPVTLA